jgi:hypothetical protein
MAEGSGVPVKPISGRAGLIANVQVLVFALQLAQETRNGRWRSLNLTEIAHLSLSAALGDGHGVLGFRDIQSLIWSI